VNAYNFGMSRNVIKERD